MTTLIVNGDDYVWMIGTNDIWIEVLDDFSPHVTEQVLMQSTGLEDKNGVEIYEQDIAKGILRYGSKEFIGEVVWNGYNLTYDLVNDHDNKGYALSSLYELEVIGNIYENPELLEGE